MSNLNITKLFNPALLILAFTFVTFAQTVKIDNITAQAAQVTEFEVNGLKVLVKRRVSSPTVAAALFIRGGSRNITDKNAGIEDLMLRSAIEAGKKYPRQAVRRELSRTGSGIGASAGNDYSIVSFATTRRNFDRVWDIFTDTLISPTFAPDDIERNRQATLTGLREVGASPEGALQTEIDRVIYAGHPYANDVSGTVATISSFNPKELKARIAASFGKLPRGDYKEQIYPQLNFAKPSVDIIARPNLPTNYIQGVFNAPPMTSPDYYPMRVAMSILQTLIFQEVRTNRQLSYAPGAELNKFAVNTANISVSSVDANQSVQIMLEQVNSMRTMRLSDEIVSEVAGNFLTTYYLSQETSAAQVAELARYELIGGGWRKTYEFLNRISSVNSDDLVAVSGKYMKNIRFVVVGDPKAINNSIFLQK